MSRLRGRAVQTGACDSNESGRFRFCGGFGWVRQAHEFPMRIPRSCQSKFYALNVESQVSRLRGRAVQTGARDSNESGRFRFFGGEDLVTGLALLLRWFLTVRLWREEFFYPWSASPKQSGGKEKGEHSHNDEYREH